MVMACYRIYSITNKFQFIEKLDYVKRKTDPFIDVPVKLERYLMEGAYNLMVMKVFGWHF
jgi:hypothetical protein